MSSNLWNAISIIEDLVEIKQAWDGRKCRGNSSDTNTEPTPAPLPESRPIRDIRFKWNTFQKRAKGTDNWPCTWARDGSVWMIGGDGYGFSEKHPKRSLIVSRRIGSSYMDVAHGDGKSYGCIALGNTLYHWHGPGSLVDAMRQTNMVARDISPAGKARVVAKKNFWNFDRGIFQPCIIQHGPNNQWARDGWIYSLSTHGSKLKAEIQEGPGGDENCGLWLFKQPIGDMLNPGAVQYFKGLIGGHPLWTPHLSQAKHVVVMHKSLQPSCCYVRPINRYILFNSFDWRGGNPWRSDLQVWDAEFPWGPWRKVNHWINWGQGHIYPSCFFWNIDPSTISNDGKRMRMVFTGVGENDAYMAMNIELVV